MVVYVMNRGPSPKGDEDEEANELSTAEIPEHIGDHGVLTPTSSVEQVAAPLATPIDTMPMTNARSLPGTFPIQDTLHFDNRNDRSYYATPPQYDSFSQTMLSTPVSAEMISPHDVSVFDYSQNPFPTSSPADQARGAASSHYDSWAPHYRQTLFSPVDYAPAGAVPPPPMSYHIPMPSPAQMHDMSHPAHMDSRPLPFRTGSLPNGLPIPHHA